MIEDSAVRIALVYPDLLGTYGDSGNATILAQRLRWRCHHVETLTVLAGEIVPDSCDIYVMGGGEDLPQTLAAKQLGRNGPVHRALESGAALLAVCAGVQIIGESFVGVDGRCADGMGLVDMRSVQGEGPRAVGELLVQPASGSGIPTMSGYENHAGRTIRGPGVASAGTVLSGVGNGDGSDGVTSGHIWGTYLHGPVLARNPALADMLIGWVVGGELEPLDDSESEELRRERLRAARGEASKGSSRSRRGRTAIRRLGSRVGGTGR